jgi:Cd2+/Zn2+-exporting ATPase
MSNLRLDLRVSNLDCENDAAKIERGFRGFTGLVEVKVYPKTAKVALEYDPEVVSPEVLEERLGDLGYAPQRGMTIPGPPRPWKNPKVLTSVAAGVILLISWLLGFSGAPVIASTTLYITAIAVGGYFFGREALEGLVFERKIGIELLMAVAAVVAASMGQVAEGAVLVFLYSISEAAEGYTEEKTRSAIKALMDLAPKRVLIRRDGAEEEVSVEVLSVGDVFIVRPGEGIATDGVVILGESSVNQAPVTGESVSVVKRPGDEVYAGSINEEGAIEVRANKSFADNTISRIIQLVEEAHERKGKSQRFIERFGARYSPAVLLLGILIALLPPLFFAAAWSTWITRATVFIVAAAPCALVISIPVTLVAALGTGARQGVLVKGGVYLEELAKVRVVALDKTGTLTRGEPDVTDIVPLGPGGAGGTISSQELLAVAAGIERRSEHALARAIVRRAEEDGVVPVPVERFRSFPGAGAMARIEGRHVYVGNPALFKTRLSLDLGPARREVERLQGEGKTVVIVGNVQSLWGLIALRDSLRANVQETIAGLHELGIDRVVMLTGDNENAARAIAREAGIDHFYAELRPEDKVEKVRELAVRHGHVAMVGDGVNDAPALAEATVGVAMGAIGTDVALETADVALMADDLAKLLYALRLARRNQRVVRQNLGLSAVVIGALVTGAVAGVFTLPVAVLGHEISEFAVIGSGLRMLRA